MLAAFTGTTVASHWGVAFTAIEFGSEQILVFTADSARCSFVFLDEMLYPEEKIIVDDSRHPTGSFGSFVEIVPNIALVMKYPTDAILIELLTTGSTNTAIIEVSDNICSHFAGSITGENLTNDSSFIFINIEFPVFIYFVSKTGITAIGETFFCVKLHTSIDLLGQLNGIVLSHTF